jgi:hypothetical protein
VAAVIAQTAKAVRGISTGWAGFWRTLSPDVAMETSYIVRSSVSSARNHGDRSGILMEKHPEISMTNAAMTPSCYAHMIRSSV